MTKICDVDEKSSQQDNTIIATYCIIELFFYTTWCRLITSNPTSLRCIFSFETISDSF